VKGSDGMFPTIDKRETGINLRKIMDNRGFTVKEIQRYLGLGSVQSIYHWLNGLSMPTIDNLYALSELFQMPIDALVRGNRVLIAPEITFEIDELHERRLRAYYVGLGKMRAA